VYYRNITTTKGKVMNNKKMVFIISVTICTIAVLSGIVFAAVQSLGLMLICLVISGISAIPAYKIDGRY